MFKKLKQNWILAIGVLFIILFMTFNASAQEQFVGIGGGADLNAIESSTFDFTWGIKVAEGQHFATTLRMSNKYSDFSEDFLQNVVNIEPLGLEIVGMGSIGATSGEGLTRFNYGGGIGGIQDLSKFSDRLKNCGVFVGAKFMRNDFTQESKGGGISRLVFEFVYRFGGDQ